MIVLGVQKETRHSGRRRAASRWGRWEWGSNTTIADTSALILYHYHLYLEDYELKQPFLFIEQVEKVRIVLPHHFADGRRTERSFDSAVQNVKLMSFAVSYGTSFAAEFRDSCIETQNSKLRTRNS